MQILKTPIQIQNLKEISQKMFGNLVKAVVDVEREIMAIDAELHSDLAELFVVDGSKGRNLWGINLYPEIKGDDWLEFDSMINIKPLLNNRTRGVDDPIIREKIFEIVNKYILKNTK